MRRKHSSLVGRNDQRTFQNMPVQGLIRRGISGWNLMTETITDASEYEHITDDIAAIVDDYNLPESLQHRIYETIEERGEVPTEKVDDIAQAIASRYEDSRVDAHDPVGTVSAQSIGEPGTQMSIEADESIVIRRDGETELTEIGSFVDTILTADNQETRITDGHEIALAPNGLEVPSLDTDEQIRWKHIEAVSRHASPDEILLIELESGRSIRATKAHSFVTRRDGDVLPVAGETLVMGDVLPTVGSYDHASGSISVPLQSQSVAADGGTVEPNTNITANAERDSTSITSAGIIGSATWERISSIETVAPEYEYVYDLSVSGLETFTTGEGVVTHNTMNTFHYAGVAEIDVTQGLPRLIELVDARKTPDTPTMTVYLEEEYANERPRAHEVVWQMEATKILALGDISTNVADMLVQVDLNAETLNERWPTIGDADLIAEEVQDIIENNLGVSTRREKMLIEFGPSEPSYRRLLQLVEELRDIVFKGLEDISRVVIRKEDNERTNGEEFVLYTEGSALGDVLPIEGVDASRTTSNNIHEVHRNLGIEAARESIINETMETLREQGLDDVNVRHLMLVADIMTNRGEIESIGRHGISGSKDSVLARAAFEVTVNHLLDAAVHGEEDDLEGVIENVIVGKPVAIGTGDVDLRMGSIDADSGRSANSGGPPELSDD
ncbi:DNA-directed RNA polymerase subunit A'' [Haloquadratum walsbyi]